MVSFKYILTSHFVRCKSINIFDIKDIYLKLPVIDVVNGMDFEIKHYIDCSFFTVMLMRKG